MVVVGSNLPVVEEVLVGSILEVEDLAVVGSKPGNVSMVNQNEIGWVVCNCRIGTKIPRTKYALRKCESNELKHYL